MLKRNIFVLIWILTLQMPNVFSQEYSFELLDTKSGLSQNDVNCILQDSKGFMWFGTNDGLNRYDGLNFETFRIGSNDESGGINSNLIRNLIEDENSNICVATIDNGVSVFNYSKEEFELITSDDGPVPNEDFYDVEFVMGDQVWLRSNREIYFLDRNYKPKLNNGSVSLEFDGNLINDILGLNDSTVLVCTSRGLYVCRKTSDDTFSTSLIEKTRSTNIMNVTLTEGGSLITTGHTIGFVDYDFKVSLGSASKAVPILVSSKGEVWVGGNQGVFKFPKQAIDSLPFRSAIKINVESVLKHAINFQHSCLYEDHEGNIWIGTEGAGVIKVSEKKDKFNHFQFGLNSENISKYAISSIYEDSFDNLWVGTRGGGISILKGSESQYQDSFSDIPVHKDWEDVRAFHEFEYQNEKWLISGTSYPTVPRTFKIDQDTIIQKPFPRKIVSDHFTTSITSDSSFVWSGTYEGGLYRYNLKTNELDNFRVEDGRGISSNVIRNLLFDHKGRLWIATDNGLNRLEKDQLYLKNPYFHNYKRLDSDPNSLCHNYTIPMLMTSKNELWVGTLGGGLSRYDEETESFQHINKQHGLSNNNIKSIVEDRNGDLWVSSNKGLSRIEIPSYNITNYSLEDGLQDLEFSELAGCIRSNGELVFGGPNGINVFRSDEIKAQDNFPNLVFSSIQILNRKVETEQILNGRKLLEKNIDEVEKIELNYSENSFTLHFAALDMQFADKIKYKYKLKPFDNGWVETNSSARFAKYTNIHPGRYQLQVVSSNADGAWNPDIKYVDIVIRPPWWRTTLAYMLYTILLVAIFFFFGQYSIIQIEKKNALEMERFEKEKIKELSKLKLDLFTKISHEFRTPLTVITGFIDKLAKESEISTTERENHIGVIRRNSNSLLRLTRQLTDFRKFEEGKLGLSVLESNIIEFARKVYQSFSVIADEKKIEFSFGANIDECNIYFDADKIEKVLYNLLSNAFKFTPEEGKVLIFCNCTEDKVQIEVSDSGIGIPYENQEHIFDLFFRANKIENMGTGVGLTFAKSMVELHHGNLECKSEMGIGTSFKMTLLKGAAHFSPEDFADTNISQLENLTENSEWKAHPMYEVSSTDGTANNLEKEKILIVEDTPDVREVLKVTLGKQFEVLTAENGQEGLEKARELNPDLVISDIVMPRMDGKELCQTLKKEPLTSHLPVILLTAYSSDEQQLEGLYLGADDYIAKPFMPDILLARVKNLLASRRLLKQRFSNEVYLSPKEMSLSSYDEKLLEDLIALIDENLEEETLDTVFLADQLGYSKRQLSRKVESLTSMTAAELIRTTRLKRAASLIDKGGFRLSEIRLMTGFSSRSTFNRLFKKHFGVVPSDYNKEVDIE